MPDSRVVVGADGVQLAVYERAAERTPTVVAVHGYPDDHSVWDGVADVLAERHRVVSYDVRGAGGSDHPTEHAAYRMQNLVDDLLAVLDAVSPDVPVHLLGHDWGSVQGWAAITDPRAAQRIASFTSISGPSLAYSAGWLRDVAAHGRDSVEQLARSSYVLAFQVPVLPELAIRSGLLELFARHRADRSDQLAGLAMYRANLRRTTGRPQPVPADVRVQVIAPARDPFVTPAFAAGAPAGWVQDLTVKIIPGGHWVITKRPEAVAGLIADFVGPQE